MDITKKKRATFSSQGLYSAQNPFLENETSYPVEPYGCMRHETRFVRL